MRKTTYFVIVLGALSLGACADRGRKVVAAPPPPPPGAILGSIAADRDGDGIVDGYYTADGVYHPNRPAPMPAPAPVVTRRGERG